MYVTLSCAINSLCKVMFAVACFLLFNELFYRPIDDFFFLNQTSKYMTVKANMMNASKFLKDMYIRMYVCSPALSWWPVMIASFYLIR